MTDKEIIIDGVNVAGCGSYMPKLGKYDCIALGNNSAACCKGSPNCYYKQSQRKEQEVESLKQEVKILQYNFDSATRECNEEIEFAHNQNIRWAKAWTKMWRQRNRYKKALDKIEDIFDNDDWGYCPLDNREDCHYSTFLKMRTIINEVKGASDKNEG